MEELSLNSELLKEFVILFLCDGTSMLLSYRFPQCIEVGVVICFLIAFNDGNT
jgi:hypothetical protein